MSKGLGRSLLTTLMYAGVAVFCIPCLLGKVDGLTMFQVGGAVSAVVLGCCAATGARKSAGGTLGRRGRVAR